MSDFYKALAQNTRQAFDKLKNDPEGSFPLILEAIQHTDETVRLKLISSFYAPVFEGLYGNDKEKQQQILDLLITRYRQETDAAVQIAIIECFKSFCLRVNAKTEIFRPVQINALRHSNPDVVKKAIEWCIHYYSESLNEVLADIIHTHPDQDARGRALVVELVKHQDGDYPFDARLYFLVLAKLDQRWQDIAMRAIQYVKTEQDVLRLFEIVETPGLGGVIRNNIVAYLGQITPKLGENSKAYQLYDERYSPFGVLSRMLKTPVNQPLLHSETWEKAVEAVSQGKTKLYDVGWELYAKLHQRDKIPVLRDEAVQRAEAATATRIQESYEQLMQQISQLERM